MHAHLVRTGHAAAFIPALIAADQSDGLDLSTLPGHPQRTIYTAVRAGRGSHPAVRAFRAALATASASRTPVDGVGEILAPESASESV
jgi:DNA-binding transcriptional LysR family regulator